MTSSPVTSPSGTPCAVALSAFTLASRASPWLSVGHAVNDPPHLAATCEVSVSLAVVDALVLSSGRGACTAVDRQTVAHWRSADAAARYARAIG
jgi:hypothetical protein